MTITKFTKAFLYIAYVLAIVFTVMFFMGLDGTSDRSAQNIAAAGPYLSFAYVLAFLALGLVLVFSVINVIIDPSNLKMALVGIGGLVVIAVISYMLSSDAPLNFTSKEVADIYNKDTTTLKWTDTGLYLTYTLFGISIIGMLFTELRDFFKR
ncbi:hypothetical protein [Acetobacteroides hydrogenigenes]|uniref:Uncharacterized protein n=1 Tax=Acetobacteroides hydrogenigenes TaxID=979970 RepID=A0A4R2EAY5_9BACT|nr:hypothetical protein [Acetobacteroides hydrogenigenes]TCN63094.1 hypothetical protein CLV25_11672 [Acetobacteroides hydrogenigenes]